jgi:hypothetical protein
MWWLSIKLLSKKNSWRAVVVGRSPEVTYHEINKSRLADHFNKIPRERERGNLQSILRHLFFLFMFIPSFLPFWISPLLNFKSLKNSPVLILK